MVYRPAPNFSPRKGWGRLPRERKRRIEKLGKRAEVMGVGWGVGGGGTEREGTGYGEIERTEEKKEKKEV